MRRVLWSRITFALCAAALILTGLAGCSDTAGDSAASGDLAQQVVASLGKQEGDESSGAVSAKLVGDGHIQVEYRFYPLGAVDVERELGVHLSPKLRKVFRDHADLQRLDMQVYLPYDDGYGNTTWKPAFSFAFDRNLYEKINWDNFVPQNLLDVVDNRPSQ
ncbi:hypothetical protein Tmar_0062 [Thermaerobacter marianensis DSM 12885]|uniref:Lipoprotein n=1 Tax=Thermaerobacter marianensis (strain ATCC 700841 / DSM 12885 / JCM 10246 / 7p75a) TaxID=644966 RepID=E6SKK0_THEM7|nr:hypothetical protein [Thermaerobacter marianensis]ADU50187.1 hypothetical protein Tmar_0062 [Thermaerobacter marianensis DSM 12885]